MLVCPLLSGALWVVAACAGLMLLVTRQPRARRTLVYFTVAVVLGSWLLPGLCEAVLAR